jgi:dolichol-phosphate mannosyltransferase
VPVNHRPRLRGKSNYGTLDRLTVAVADLIGVMWLQRRWKRPEVERVAGRLVEPVQVLDAPRD